MAKDSLFGTLNKTRATIPGLDGIRGLAVLIVFIFHAEILPHVPGELATTVFFFLSGFLITTLFLRERKKTGDLDLGSFYYRRALRILPPLYLVLGIALCLKMFGHVGTAIVPWKASSNFLQFTNIAIAMTQDGGGFLPGMILLWSLAVDEHYYLLYAPFLKRALNKFSPAKIAFGLVTLCVAALAWRMFLVHAQGATMRVAMATDTRLDSILWGAILALWCNAAQEPAKAAWLAKPLPVIIGLIMVLLPSFTGNDNMKVTLGYTMEGIGLMPLFTLAILQGGKGFLKFLHWPSLLWMSRISYSFYLFSWLMLSTVRKFVHGPRVEQVLLAFVLTFCLASVMHLLVERPLMAMRKKSKATTTESGGTLQPVPLAS
ncbi:MAG TPA: acyltransferase [Fimbriimonadaceae bacterium]|jgi:peptidoglycan/LPS O-acetylase OafA/YrhL